MMQRGMLQEVKVLDDVGVAEGSAARVKLQKIFEAEISVIRFGPVIELESPKI